jgi:hypothetical protein
MMATLRPVDIVLFIFAIAETVGSIAVFIVWSEQSPSPDVSWGCADGFEGSVGLLIGLIGARETRKPVWPG